MTLAPIIPAFAPRCEDKNYTIVLEFPPISPEEYTVVFYPPTVPGPVTIKIAGETLGSLPIVLRFTSANVAIPMTTRSSTAVGINVPAVLIPYSVTAPYAPSWNKMDGFVKVTLGVEACCPDKEYYHFNMYGWHEDWGVPTPAGTTAFLTNAGQSNCYVVCADGTNADCPPDYPPSNFDGAYFPFNVEGAFDRAMSLGDISHADKLLFYASTIGTHVINVPVTHTNGGVTMTLELTGTFTKAANTYEVSMANIKFDTLSGGGQPTPSANTTVKERRYYTTGIGCVRIIALACTQLETQYQYSHGVLCTYRANTSKAFQFGVKI